MKKHALFVWALLAGLCWSAQVDAQQVFTKRTIGFETAGCGNTALTFPESDIIFANYQAMPSDSFVACGISSITSTSDGVTVGKQRYVDPTGNIAGMTGNVVMAGALDLNLPLTQTETTITFSPAVNELSFDVLDLDNKTGLKVTLNGASGPIGSPLTPMADANGIVHFSTVSTTPITNVVISYTPSNILGDGWFIDQLTYNAWHCGDGEKESTNGATEQCDDGNAVVCDLCGTDCKTTINGCLAGVTCVANNAFVDSTMCAQCILPAGARTTEVLPTNAGMIQACSTNTFCNVSETCNGQGACVGTPRDCSDTIDCTDDSCVEAQDTCKHDIKQGSCLIDGTCFTNGETNIDDPCERCDRSKANNGWSLKPSGTRCGDPSCTSGVLTPFPQCSAAGSCDAQAPVSCDGAVCADSISCNGACTGDKDCVANTHCDQGVCVPDVPNGEPCDRATECTSNFCVDGVCCNSVCNGACLSCDLDGHVGTCSPNAAGTDPDMDCPDAQFCGGNGKCVGENRPNGSDCDGPEVCESGFCADGVCCNAACDRSCESCDLADHIGECTPYLAGTDPEMECPNAQLCAAPGVCAPENRPNGSECSEDALCASGHCADGVCCESACDGVCEACNMAEQAGMCVPFAAGTDPANECSGDAVCSGERACVSYETRGNGLCSMNPGRASSGALLAGLFGLAALLTARRRSKRA
ncbi:MAG: hypothetical protein QM778_11650 [Myxococcales bacterium]